MTQITAVISGIAILLLVALVILYLSVVPSNKNKLPSMKFKDHGLKFPEKVYGDSNHHYFNSKFGLTHYYVLGPESGKRIVFIHGITAPSLTLKHFLSKLASKGFRVLCYDMFGRGFSDCPGNNYDRELYVQQLYDLVKHVGWNKCSILGYSMGIFEI